MKAKVTISAFVIIGLVFALYVLAQNIPEAAKSIKEGKIRVGEDKGMEPGKRYHNIHNEFLGLDCTSCHISEFSPDYVYQRKYKEISDMGHVDRGICLGCHKENGPAITKLYGTAEK